MSEAAAHDRRAKQRWAVPGSAHDRLVRWTKVALPSAVGVLIAVLTVAPLDRRGDVSFILDKKKVDNAPERMRVEAARYSGTDNQGQRFVMVANSAVQRSSDVPLVDVRDVRAQLALPQGPMSIMANQGRYNLETQRIAVIGPVRVIGPEEYRLATSNVMVDLKQRRVTSTGPVSGQMRLGRFQAGQLHADLGARTVVLDGGVRLKIIQGAVR